MNAHITQDEPSAWVARFAGLIPAGRVLDLACGGGRHARLMAGLGHAVLAVDRDTAALAAASGPGIDTLAFDLEDPTAASHPDWPLLPRVFAGIVVSNYLHRALKLPLLDSLAPGGILIYETFASGNGQFGKPSNPDFLLKPGELLEWANSLSASRVIAYEDGYQHRPRPAMVQRICLRKADSASDPQPLALALDVGDDPKVAQ
jgi:SAM-dependent methyltransferase